MIRTVARINRVNLCPSIRVRYRCHYNVVILSEAKNLTTNYTNYTN